MCLVEHEQTIFWDESTHPQKVNEVNFPSVLGYHLQHLDRVIYQVVCLLMPQRN